jgi:hypothetical protein
VLIIQEDDKEIILNWVNDVTSIFGSGEIQFSFSESLKPYLLQLKEKFTEYRYYNIIQIKSSYSIRIYELLKQYEKIRRRKFKVDELREILGIEEGKYSNYADFKRKVILTAEKELFKKTDIYFTFKEKKKGKKVDELEFIIYRNIATEENVVAKQDKADTYDLFHNHPDPSDLTPGQKYILDQLMAIGFIESEAKRIVEDPYQYVNDPVILEDIKNKKITKEEYIQEKIDYFRLEKEAKQIEKPTGFIIQALKKNFWNERIEKEKVIRRKAIERRRKLEQVELLEKEKTKIGNERVTITQGAIIRLNKDNPEIFENIISKLREESKFAFSGYNDNKTAFENYANRSMLNALVNRKYVEEYAHLYPETEKRILALDKQFNEIEKEIKKLEQYVG